MPENTAAKPRTLFSSHLVKKYRIQHKYWLCMCPLYYFGSNVVVCYSNQTPLLKNWSAKEKKNPIDVFFSHDRYQKKIVNKLPNDGNGQTSLLILFSWFDALIANAISAFDKKRTDRCYINLKKKIGWLTMGYVNQHCKPRALIALDQVVMCLDGKPGVNQGQKCRILIGLFF